MRGRQDPVWVVRTIFEYDPFPVQEEIIREFYRDRYNPTLTPYKRLFIIAGMRSGKTALAGMIGAYEFWEMSTLPNPSQHFGLIKNQEIFSTVIAPSEKQAQDGVFGNISRAIEYSDWMNTWVNIKLMSEKIVSVDNFVTLQVLGSWASTGVGRSNFLLLMDEMDTFEDTSGKRGAQEVFTRLSKSTDTFGTRGHIMGITSPRSPTSLGMTLYNEGLNDPRTLVYLKPTWEMNPNLTKAALVEEHKHNMMTFYRDYACEPGLWAGVQFPEGVWLTKMPNVLKDIYEGIPVTTPRFHVLAIDPATKNDSFGIACGYKNSDGTLTIDGVWKFQKREGDMFIMPSDIRNFLDKAIPQLGVSCLVHDTWMFPDILEHVMRRWGVPIEKHVVKKPDYDRWRSFQESGQAKVVYDDNLKWEAERLNVVGEKVDHPYAGSKDMADCVANVMWYLTEYKPIDLKPGVAITYVI